MVSISATTFTRNRRIKFVRSNSRLDKTATVSLVTIRKLPYGFLLLCSFSSVSFLFSFLVYLSPLVPSSVTVDFLTPRSCSLSSPFFFFPRPTHGILEYPTAASTDIKLHKEGDALRGLFALQQIFSDCSRTRLPRSTMHY